MYSRPGPLSGRYLNIDSVGLRVVPRYRVPGGKPLRVFFQGGSTTWGWYDRDSSTRPAVVARQVAAEMGLEPSTRQCARVADSLAAAQSARSIVDWSALHSDDSGTVYLDQASHTTERATAVEADTLTRLLLARLRTRRPVRSPAPSR